MKREDLTIEPVLRYWMDRFELPANSFGRPGTTAYADEAFVDSLEITITHIGERAVLRFDPALESRLRLADGLETRATGAAELIDAQTDGLRFDQGPGGLYLYLDAAAFEPFVPPGNPETRLIDPVKEDAVLRAFYAACSEEDLDEAEIYVDEPDPVIFGVFMDGRMVGYSSHRIWGDNIADIGVLTHPDYRGRGLGKGAVSALCEWHFANGVLPMYRVGGANHNSQRVALGLGFTLMVEIEVLKVIAE
jgi:RimJ/RimL family protein N-acetyltransferase